MIRVLFATCCEQAIHDFERRTVSLIQIVEGWSVVSFPVFIPAFAFIVFLERAEDDPVLVVARLRVTLGELEVATQAVSVDFEGKMRTKFTARFGGMPIVSAGDLKFEFVMDDSVGIWIVPIAQVQIPPPESSPADV